MDQTVWIIIGGIAGVFSILGVLYLIIFGDRNLFDYIKRKSQSNTEQGEQNLIREGNYPGKLSNGKPEDVDENEPIEPTSLEEAKDYVEELISRHDYELVCEKAPEYWRKYCKDLDRGHLNPLLNEMELLINYAKAQIYTGRIDSALDNLENIIKTVSSYYFRFNKIDRGWMRANTLLGLAHNHRGYINWMEYGHYHEATNELSKAIAYLRIAKNQSAYDLGKAYDNLGRVYGMLGYREYAMQLVLKGLNTHLLKSKNQYGIALSLNSLAIIELMFGNPYRAEELAESAYKKFETIHESGGKKTERGARGLGLATITKARSLRLQGEYWKEASEFEEQKSLSETIYRRAILELSFALAIFSGSSDRDYVQKMEDAEISSIREPIREFDAKYELGCTYRDLSNLLRSSNQQIKRRRIKQSDNLASKHLVETIKLVDIESSDGFIEERISRFIDVRENYARFLLESSNVKDGVRVVEKTIRDVEQTKNNRIKSHVITKKVLLDIDPKNCYEELWRHLSKLYALRASFRIKTTQTSNYEDVFIDSLKDYFLASVYYQRFLTGPVLGDKQASYGAIASPYSAQQSRRQFLIREFVASLTQVNYDRKKLSKLRDDIFLLKKEYKLDDFFWISDLIDGISIYQALGGNDLYSGIVDHPEYKEQSSYTDTNAPAKTISTITPQSLISETLNQKMKEQKYNTKILLVTVTEIEATTVIKLFKQIIGEEPKSKSIENETYYDLGIVGGAKVHMVTSEMGSGGPGGSTLTVDEAIDSLSPSAIISVGIAFGINSKKQKIGDILVSEKLLSYEMQKVGTDISGEAQLFTRGSRPDIPVKILDRFKSGIHNWKGNNVSFGIILSGDKLIDNIDFRDQLQNLEPEAIGGEMEGAGLYAAAQRAKKDWIIVKAICDWADGNKGQNKKENQRIAAENSIRYVIHVLQQGGFVDS